MPRLLLTGLSALVLCACSTSTSPAPSKPTSFDVLGVFELNGSPTRYGGDGDVLVNPSTYRCRGTNGYDDIGGGAQVIVTDEGGHTVALGHLSGGRFLVTADTKLGPLTCSFNIEVSDVPAGHRFYGILVSHRGTRQFSEADMRGDPVVMLGDGS